MLVDLLAPAELRSVTSDLFLSYRTIAIAGTDVPQSTLCPQVALVFEKGTAQRGMPGAIHVFECRPESLVDLTDDPPEITRNLRENTDYEVLSIREQGLVEEPIRLEQVRGRQMGNFQLEGERGVGRTSYQQTTR